MADKRQDVSGATRPIRNGLKRNGIRLGLGLQLVNILRDVEEDRVRGRRYLPEGDRFPTCSIVALEYWTDIASRFLLAGVDYAETLPRNAG